MEKKDLIEFFNNFMRFVCGQKENFNCDLRWEVNDLDVALFELFLVNRDKITDNSLAFNGNDVATKLRINTLDLENRLQFLLQQMIKGEYSEYGETQTDFVRVISSIHFTYPKGKPLYIIEFVSLFTKFLLSR